MRKTEELSALRGVGPQLAKRLSGLGIHSVQDLLFHLPIRYEDRTRLQAIGSLTPGTTALIEGQIEHSAIVRGRRATLIVVVSDGTGRITLRFFHFRAHQKNQLGSGTEIRCFGDVRPGFKGLEMAHPSYTRLIPGKQQPLADRLTPIYPSTEGMGQSTWIKLTDQALDWMHEGRLDLAELLPSHVLKELALPSLAAALDLIHRPPPAVDLALLMDQGHPAQHRLALEELLAHNVSMRLIHRKQREHRSPVMATKSDTEETFLQRLPFQLTGAQQRVTSEIQRDLAQDHPMLRLVHGDVGSGKTVVAALAAMRAIGNGYQVAIMAPTELLAEQHLKVFSDWLIPLGIEPVWVSGKVTGKARALAMNALLEGSPVAIGTHALMQEGVAFRKLGLVIVDEQHRFGVHQRMSLVEKGKEGQLRPHQMIMTATPIPRTLAMTAYAGLQVSVIDELPAGRKPVTTAAISNSKRDQVLQRVASACSEGRQAYWVCTLIEESDAIEAQAAEAVATELADELKGLSIGLVHGRMKPAEKQMVMNQFSQGNIQLLVATTVIEVGVDVPNASLMIIENAERLGLAQLHQLRGRVGRGSQQSSCVLLYDAPLGEMARQRLGIMRATTDGFEIAEKDLELRGPGEVLGTRQTGMLQFRVADLARDAHLLDRIPPIADELLKNDRGTVDELIRRWVGDAARFAGV